MVFRLCPCPCACLSWTFQSFAEILCIMWVNMYRFCGERAEAALRNMLATATRLVGQSVGWLKTARLLCLGLLPISCPARETTTLQLSE